MEVWTLVRSKPTMTMLLVRYLMIVLVVFSGCFILVSPVIFFPLTLLLGFLLYLLMGSQKIEYEYSYYAGDFRVAKIKNMSKRKDLLEISMDDILLVAPQGHEKLKAYENPNQSYEICDYSSREKSHSYYVMVCKSDKKMRKLYFEPDIKLLQAMQEKNRQKIILSDKMIEELKEEPA
ncbi:MAG: DUF6106 family protein [Lachnospiraceae bacterium]